MSRVKTVANTKEDPTVPYVTLNLKGDEYKLCYDFNSLARAEALTGLNLFQGLDLTAALTLIQLRALLWAAMAKAQPELTLEEVGDLIAGRIQCSLAVAAITKAWIASMPKPEPVDPNV